MNLMLARTKQCYSVLWEPFATSTPLKPVNKDGKPGNGLQNKPSIDSFFQEKPHKRCNISSVKHSESKQLPSKKGRKNRSCAYYDLTSSSSSDDDASDVKKRPVIKLSSKTRTRSLLGNKNAGVGDSRSLESNDKPKNVDTDVQIILDSSGERIFDESNKRCLEEKAGIVSDAPKHAQQVNETRKRQVNDKVLVKLVNKDGSRRQKTVVKIKNTKASKAVKRKAPTVKDEQPEHPLSDTKPNLSHQLFSESREQEFINTLDLTAAEINEPVPNRRSLILKNTQNKQTNPSRDTSNAENEPGRPSQRKERKRKEVADGKTVFKPLSELSFNENDTGCSVVQCHSVNNLKCGVFKLKTKSQLNHKTLHHNSHLGGVVVKGTLHMKIGDKELDMKEGDTAFVPPLTKWQATNTGASEAVFYYWCGRFK